MIDLVLNYVSLDEYGTKQKKCDARLTREDCIAPRNRNVSRKIV